MANALKDVNSVASLMAVLNTDTVQGTNKVRIAVDPATNQIKTTTTATISFTMKPIDPKDENSVGLWLFQGLDGLPYPAVATSLGELLIDQI